MGFMQRFERKLEGAVGNTFARVFGGKIMPAEVEDALQREASHRVQNLNGHALAPNHYVLTVSESDEENLTSDTELTLNAFAKHLTGYIGEQGWETYGAVSVELESSPDLHTGQFRAHSVISPDDASHIGAPHPSAHHPQPGATQMPSEQYDAPQPRYQPQPDPQQYQQQAYRRPQYEDQQHADEQFRQPPAQAYSQRPPAGQPYTPQPYAPQPYAPQAYAPQPQDPEQQYQQPRQPDAPQAEPRYVEPQYPGAQQPGQQHSDAQSSEPPYQDDQFQDDQHQDSEYGAALYSQPEGPVQAYSQRPDHGSARQQRYSSDQYADPRFQPPAHLYPPQQPSAPHQPAPEHPAPQQPPAEQPGQYPQPGYGYQDQAYAGQAYPLRDPAAGYYADDRHSPPQQAWAAQAPAVSLELGDGSGRNLELRHGSNIIGRGQDAHFRIPDTGVSRQHADIQWDGTVALVVDLQSTNGTVVNDTPVNEWQLADGDVIRIGHSDITVRFH